MEVGWKRHGNIRNGSKTTMRSECKYSKSAKRGIHGGKAVEIGDIDDIRADAAEVLQW